MNRLLTLLMASTVSLLGQTTAPVITGSVSGRVLDADTNTPLVGVELNACVGRSGCASAKTDQQGGYVFEKLPPGNRSIEVYDGNLGPSMTPSHSVTVIGGRDTQVDFHTRLFAQVSGRVLDGDGNPIAGVQVTANMKEYEGAGFEGHRSHTDEVELVSRRASGLTDDQGRYVITTLSAGLQYWIVASSPRRYAVPISDAPTDPQARRRTLAATYYPSSDSIDTASAIRLHSQEVRDDVDIRMLKVESYCLEATLTELGVPARMQFLLLETAVSSTRLPSGNLPESSESGSDGKIRLCDLYPGQFRLIAARLSSRAQESIGAVDITISNKDVRNLVVPAIPRSTLSGELMWDKQPIDASSPQIRVTTYPSPGPNPRVPVVGTFSLDVVAGSSYIVAISGLDSHSYVKDVTYGGSSILYQPFVPSGGDTKLRVTIGSDAGSITTTVLTASGQPAIGAAVLLVPVTARTEPDIAASFRAGVTDENGVYIDSGLPPGKYDVFATDNPPPNRIDRGQIMLIDRTPEAVGKILRARARGKQVEVNPNGAASVVLVSIRLD